MIKRITTFILLASSSLQLFSQTIRTDVLVVGGTAAGISAGIQAARSGVKTIMISENQELETKFSENDLLLFERIRNYKKPLIIKNSQQNIPIQAETGSMLVKSITDTLKNLTIKTGTTIRKIEKNGKGWEVKFQDGKTLKADAVIDATENSTFLNALNLKPARALIDLPNFLARPDAFPRVFRSSVGYGKYVAGPDYPLPLASLLPLGTENLFVIPQREKSLIVESIPAGQAAGAAAAYCSFFKTSTKNLNIRVIQGELLAFEAVLAPYSDIKITDRHQMAFQHLALTGLLEPKQDVNSKMPRSALDTLATVSTEELRQPMKEYYSRSQIWFADKKIEKLTIGEVISLLMFTASRGEELRTEIEKGWKSSLKLNSNYDPARAINRREFAVLADTYLQPFNRKIDLSGNLLN